MIMKKVLVVHCVDTEGPLYESLEDTFLRLTEIFGIDALEPTRENLEKLQTGRVDLGSREEEVARVFSKSLLDYNDGWAKLDRMLARIMSDSFRLQFPDHRGNGWLYNWFCMDHLDYETNPRRRAVGMHVIFDHYRKWIKDTAARDRIHWHFHPQSTYREGEKLATSYVNSPNLYKIICRRIIERDWFPTAHRAGFHTERPDSHWFLEQWLPFDYSNQAYPGEQHPHRDLGAGRYGDWRWAPSDWSVYHPAHDHYQMSGTCRRKIARCLNIGTRLRLLTAEEVHNAFRRASSGQTTILAFCNHDFREMSDDIAQVYRLLHEASRSFLDVEFEYCDAIEAMRRATFTPEELRQERKLDFEPRLTGNVLSAQLTSGRLFGPQPFLAIKTRDRRFIHDNFDLVELDKCWSYTFDSHTIPLSAVETLGVASNDVFGNVCIKKCEVASR